MFCPECKSEYNPGITVCADCGSPLVENLSGETEADAGDKPVTGFAYENLVTVLQTYDQGLFLLAESILEEAGIRHCVSGGVIRHYMGLSPGGPPCLQVRKVDEERAKELLSDFLQTIQTGGDARLAAEAERLCCTGDELE